MRELVEPLIVAVSGPDRPGILAALSTVLAEEGIELVDIEQATLQDFLALSFLLDLRGDPRHSSAVLHRFLAEARRWGLHTDVRSLSQDEVVSLDEKHLWALTLLGSGDIASTIAALARVTAQHGANIVSIRRLAEDDLRAAELIVDARGVSDERAFRSELLGAGEGAGADLALAREDLYRRNKRVVVLDADSTLVAGELIDRLAERAGVGEQVREITARAMAGELDFAESLRRRVTLLAGLEESVLEDVAESMRLTPGAEETIGALKALGLKVGVISGGFRFFTERLRERLGLDYAYANELEIVEGRVSGRVLGEIVDAQAKATLLDEIAAREGVQRSQIVGVGDGANDIPMLRRAGLGVAFRARPATRAAADASIQRDNLRALLYLLGVSARELQNLEATDRAEA